MKILHIVAEISPESGVATVVTRLAVEQCRLGHQVCVACTGREKSISSLVHYCISEKDVRVLTFRPSWPHFLYFSWGMLFGLRNHVNDSDVVHVHSNWTFPVWRGGWLALRHKKTLVMSPHGALDPVRLQHSAWKKRLVGWIDRWLLQRADVIHATCEAEREWVAAFLECANEGKKTLKVERLTLNAQRLKPKIVVIPNGVECNAKVLMSDQEHYECLDQQSV